MLVVLTGKTCSGKTTVQEALEGIGCQKIITFTTRPIRPGEKDGVTYNFLSKEEFLKRREEGFFLETAEYHTLVDNIPDTWYYGSSKEDFRMAAADMRVYVIILQQAGLKALKESDIPYAALYLNVSDETILSRQSVRKDNEAEAKRRIAADREAFRDILDLVDAEITADNSTVEEITMRVLNAAGTLTGLSRGQKVPEDNFIEGVSFRLNGGYRNLKETEERKVS